MKERGDDGKILLSEGSGEREGRGFDNPLPEGLEGGVGPPESWEGGGGDEGVVGGGGVRDGHGVWSLTSCICRFISFFREPTSPNRSLYFTPT